MTLQTIINLCLGLGDLAAGDLAADSQATTTPPMTPADFVRKATAVFETFYTERAIPITPFLAFRTSDVIAAWMHLRAVETQLREEGLVIRPAKDSNKRVYANPLVPLAARAWDRLRRAIKELERALPKTKEPVAPTPTPPATKATAPAPGIGGTCAEARRSDAEARQSTATARRGGATNTCTPNSTSPPVLGAPATPAPAKPAAASVPASPVQAGPTKTTPPPKGGRPPVPPPGAGAPLPPATARRPGEKLPYSAPVSPLSELGFLGFDRWRRATPTRREMIRAAIEGVQFPA